MSWEQLAEMDAFGTSPFQNLCCTKVSRLIPGVCFEEQICEEQKIDELDLEATDATEKYFVAELPTINMKVYVYLDRAEIVSSDADIRFDRANSKTPDDLALKVIRELSNSF